MAEEIKEVRGADEAGQHANAVVVDVDDPPWVKYMEAKLAFKSKHCKPSHPFTICRVPRDIRSVDNVAHDPLIVSIGPYHRGNPSLHEMEEFKWRNLNETRRRDGNKFKKYLMEMKEIEPQARDCYSGNINMEADEFIEMMLLDGLFVIALLRGRTNHYFPLNLLPIVSYGQDPILTVNGMLCRVGHDMLLLENQLPLFVLERLWKLTGGKRLNLWKSACNFLRRFALRFEHQWSFKILREIFAGENDRTKEKKNPKKIDADDVHHLLHLVYLFLEPTSLKRKSESMEPTAKLPAWRKKILSFLPSRCHWFPSQSGLKSESMECTAKLTAVKKKNTSPSGQKPESMEGTAKLPAVKKKILPFLPARCHWFPSPSAGQKSSSKSKNKQPLMVIPCAAELDEAGVEFQCVRAKSFLDVAFEQETMKMPRLSVQYFTKSLLRNFIAFEQCFPNRGCHFTSYCNFMDNLVNTPRDVEILRKAEIIENKVGSDEEVARLFNDLLKGVLASEFCGSYLAKPFKAVMAHTRKPWPKRRAILMHDYFRSPWSIISFFAATFVIILTMAQTYCSVFPDLAHTMLC